MTEAFNEELAELVRKVEVAELKARLAGANASLVENQIRHSQAVELRKNLRSRSD